MFRFLLGLFFYFYFYFYISPHLLVCNKEFKEAVPSAAEKGEKTKKAAATARLGNIQSPTRPDTREGRGVCRPHSPPLLRLLCTIQNNNSTTCSTAQILLRPTSNRRNESENRQPALRGEPEEKRGLDRWPRRYCRTSFTSPESSRSTRAKERRAGRGGSSPGCGA